MKQTNYKIKKILILKELSHDIALGYFGYIQTRQL